MGGGDCFVLFSFLVLLLLLLEGNLSNLWVDAIACIKTSDLPVLCDKTINIMVNINTDMKGTTEWQIMKD